MSNDVGASEYNQKDEITPSWVRRGGYKVSLDRYYTCTDIAEYCYQSLLREAVKCNIDVDDCVFLEPSAGDGAFFNLLPNDRRVGMDVTPRGEGIAEGDFFDWSPDRGKKYITVGNPPFGLRGWLALAFINRAAEFSDLVGFILPMYFDSDGKGSAKNRVRGLTLIHSEELPSDIFHNGKAVKINTVWQVWGKVAESSTRKDTCDDFVDVFTVCTYPRRRCGLDKMDKYDFFIPSTFYGSARLCDKFEDVAYGAGYGIVIKADREEIGEYLRSVDWLNYSTRATNHCRHIGKQHIARAMIDGGFVDVK